MIAIPATLLSYWVKLTFYCAVPIQQQSECWLREKNLRMELNIPSCDGRSRRTSRHLCSQHRSTERGRPDTSTRAKEIWTMFTCPLSIYYIHISWLSWSLLPHACFEEQTNATKTATRYLPNRPHFYRAVTHTSGTYPNTGG